MIPAAVRHTVGGALFVLVAGYGLGGGRAFAEDAAAKVTVIRPIGGDAGLVEIATRAWAELNAGGIAATLVDCSAARDACLAASPPPGSPPPARDVITLTTFRSSDEIITEAALTPAGHDHPTVRRSLTVSDEAAADPKVMAIRAVELVNAMLIQVDTTAAEDALAQRRASIADAEYPGQHFKAEPAVVDPETAWSAGAGAAFLKGNGGLSAALGFAIRAGRQVRGRVGVSVLLAEAPSLGGTPALDGSLSTNQQLAAVEVTYRVHKAGRVTSHLALGAGGYHVSASWSGPPSVFGPTVPGSAHALWALLLSGGGGAVLTLGHEMSLFLEARAVLASPSPVVAGADGRPLKTADPSLLMSLGLQRTF